MTDYAQIPTNLICRFGELSKTEIRVLCFLYTSRNRKTGRCNPSRAYIARYSGLSRTHVTPAITSLVEKGWVAETNEDGFHLFAEPKNVTELVTHEPEECYGFGNTDVTESVTTPTGDVTETVQDVTDSVTLSYRFGNTQYKDSSEQKIEQKIEQRGSAADFAPPQNQPPASSLHFHPVIEALRTVTKKNPPPVSRQLLISKVGGVIDLAKLQATYAEWAARGYKDTNFDGILDWYLGNRNGSKQNGTKFDAGKPQETQTTYDCPDCMDVGEIRIDDESAQFGISWIPCTKCKVAA